MTAPAEPEGSSALAATGVGVGLAGLAFAGLGLWARREVTRGLARERVGLDAPVRTGAAARSLAEVIRRNTLETTCGRTYAEIDAYLDEKGRPTPDAASAARDERTGQPVENPEHDLWIQSTALQTALLQAYLSARLAELTVALGLTIVAIGGGLAAAGRHAG